VFRDRARVFKTEVCKHVYRMTKTVVIGIRVLPEQREKWQREILPLARQKGVKTYELFDIMLRAVERWLKYGIPP